MNLKYRPEIDGLRALAVISVIFYHAQLTIQGIETFKGGFIGVDFWLFNNINNISRTSFDRKFFIFIFLSKKNKENFTCITHRYNC